MYIRTIKMKKPAWGFVDMGLMVVLVFLLVHFDVSATPATPEPTVATVSTFSTTRPSIVAPSAAPTPRSRRPTYGSRRPVSLPPTSVPSLAPSVPTLAPTTTFGPTPTPTAVPTTFASLFTCTRRHSIGVPRSLELRVCSAVSGHVLGPASASFSFSCVAYRGPLEFGVVVVKDASQTHPASQSEVATAVADVLRVPTVALFALKDHFFVEFENSTVCSQAIPTLASILEDIMIITTTPTASPTPSPTTRSPALSFPPTSLFHTVSPSTLISTSPAVAPTLPSTKLSPWQTAPRCAVGPTPLLEEFEGDLSSKELFVQFSDCKVATSWLNEEMVRAGADGDVVFFCGSISQDTDDRCSQVDNLKVHLKTNTTRFYHVMEAYGLSGAWYELWCDEVRGGDVWRGDLSGDCAFVLKNSYECGKVVEAFTSMLFPFQLNLATPACASNVANLERYTGVAIANSTYYTNETVVIPAMVIRGACTREHLFINPQFELVHNVVFHIRVGRTVHLRPMQGLALVDPINGTISITPSATTPVGEYTALLMAIDGGGREVQVANWSFYVRARPMFALSSACFAEATTITQKASRTLFYVNESVVIQGFSPMCDRARAYAYPANGDTNAVVISIKSDTFAGDMFVDSETGSMSILPLQPNATTATATATENSIIATGAPTASATPTATTTDTTAPTDTTYAPGSLVQTSMATLFAVDGFGDHVTIAKWRVNTIRREDTEVVGYGPHGEDCALASQRVDGVKYDGQYTCDCGAPPFVATFGDNCERLNLSILIGFPVLSLLALFTVVAVVYRKVLPGYLAKRELQSLTMFLERLCADTDTMLLPSEAVLTAALHDAINANLDAFVRPLLRRGANASGLNDKHQLPHTTLLVRKLHTPASATTLLALFNAHFEIDKQIGSVLANNTDLANTLGDIFVTLVKNNWLSDANDTVLHRVVDACRLNYINVTTAVGLTRKMLKANPELPLLINHALQTAGDLAMQCDNAVDLERLLTVVVFGDYQLPSPTSYVHRSSTSLVFDCHDLRMHNGKHEPCVLKMMSDFDAFKRELYGRQRLSSSTHAVVPLLSAAMCGDDHLLGVRTSIELRCFKPSAISKQADINELENETETETGTETGTKTETATVTPTAKTATELELELELGSGQEQAHVLMSRYPFALCMRKAGRNLSTVIDSEQLASEPLSLLQGIATKIGECVASLHADNIVHGDVKPRNFVRWGRHGNDFRSIDFDMTFRVLQHNDNATNPSSLQQLLSAHHAPATKIIATSAFVSPELLRWALETVQSGSANMSIPDKQILGGYGIDIWSFGVTLFGMVAGRPLLSNSYDEASVDCQNRLLNWDGLTANEVAEIEIRHGKYTSVPLIHLLQWVLSPCAHKRPLSMNEVLQHEFFTNIRADDVDVVDGVVVVGGEHKRHDFTPLLDPLSSEHAMVCSRVPTELESTKIKLTREIGKGNFGNIYRALYHAEPGLEYEVAVKTLRVDSGSSAREELLLEAAIVCQFTHDNVIGCIGVITTSKPYMLVLQLCATGSLLKMVRQIEDLRELDHTYWYQGVGLQIAMGMEYLASKQFVHRDLAARNILINSVNVCKVADFGLSRKMWQTTDGDGGEAPIYTSLTATTKFPIPWLAPESLSRQAFSEASDVWSYGIVMCEIYSCGVRPFPGLTMAEITSGVKEGLKPAAPESCPADIFSCLIEPCFEFEPGSRPTFGQIVTTIGGFGHGLVSDGEVDCCSGYSSFVANLNENNSDIDSNNNNTNNNNNNNNNNENANDTIDDVNNDNTSTNNTNTNNTNTNTNKTALVTDHVDVGDDMDVGDDVEFSVSVAWSPNMSIVSQSDSGIVDETSDAEAEEEDYSAFEEEEENSDVEVETISDGEPFLEPSTHLNSMGVTLIESHI